MTDTSGFYKKNEDLSTLYFARDFVSNSEYELQRASKNNYQYPVDGWYWFETLESAMALLTAPNTLETSPELLLREQAKMARSIVVESIVVEVNGKTFDGDETSQNRMVRAIIGSQAAQVPSINWTLADNTVTEVTVAELTEALILAGQRQSELWAL